MSKNANGQGTIRKRSNGVWEYMISLEDGKRKSFYAKKRADAITKYEEWKNNSTVKIEKKMTVEEWAKQWLLVYKKGTVAYGTYVNYESYVNNHIIPGLGHLSVDDVRPVHIQRFLKERQHLSLSALKHINITLKGIFATAIENKICSESPVRSIKAPRGSNKAIEVFTVDELAKITKVATTIENGHYVLLPLYTGLRVGELLALQWSDIDDEIITVKRSRARAEGGGYENKVTKSGKIRYVGITEPLRNVIDNIPRTGLYVFNERGKQLSPHQFDSRYYSVLKSLEVTPRSPHKCRHTYATYLVKGGADLRTVQAILGHSSLAVTEIYAHVDTSDIMRNVRKLAY